LEPMENLEKLFALAACTRKTKMTPIPEIAGIISQVSSCGILDNDNYFDWMNENNETSLEIAIKAGNTVIVGLILEKGDNCIRSDAFLFACRMGKKEIVKLLLQGNVHAHLDNHVQTDCVIICTKHGYYLLLCMLFEAGFRLSNTDRYVELKYPEGSVVPLLWKERTNGTLLHIAAGNGHHQIVDFLIKHDADIELVDSSGRQPIHLAVQGGIYCLMTLLRAGVNVDSVDSMGQTSLFLAASFDNLQAVKFLLSNGANIDSVNDNGLSVLLAAAFSNHDRTVKYLLDNGAAICGACPRKLNYDNSGTVLPKLIDDKTSFGTEQGNNRAILKKLEDSGNALP